VNMYTNNTTNNDDIVWIQNNKGEYNKDQVCLHTQCPECNGTGQKKNGLGICVHHLSCSCPKCTSRC
jgi:hypothetical protein